MSQQDNKEMAKHFYRASAADFKKIPGSPVAYWASAGIINAFGNGMPLGDFADVKRGMTTSDNQQFLRFWPEVSFEKVYLNAKSGEEAESSKAKWFPYSKGGGYRKWYGFLEFLINWESSGRDVIAFAKTINQSYTRTIVNIPYYFLPSVGFSYITSGPFSMRYIPEGCLYDSGGPGVFSDGVKMQFILACMNSSPAMIALKMLNPTINLQIADVVRLPLPEYSSVVVNNDISKAVSSLVAISMADWNSKEESWGFNLNPLVENTVLTNAISDGYQEYLSRSEKILKEMQHLEEENNRIFIDAYGLQDELTPEVPLSEITLTCNPHYRYGGNLTDEEREARLQSDTIAELVSYAIGCMMGRYSLDREGLVYAHAGNVGFNDLVAEGAYQRFAADSDGILPLTSEHWFEDDIAARIEEFVRTVWGADTLEENLQFIADSLSLYAIKPPKKGGETSRETIRRYLSTQFFKDHLKTYKKRPIYWLFSSGKEKAFECLVYLHRYNEATLPRMRTEYVTPLLGQMASRIERLRLQQADASTAEAKRLDKQIDGLTKQLAELRAFDDQLKHHADMKITLDLDDGVKVNYGQFGTLLSDVKAITGDKGE